MTELRRSSPAWILVVSGLFALLEIMVSLALLFSPASVVDTVDLNAKGIDYLLYIWAARQFALGVIFAVATIKRSTPMLTLAYIFFLVMMAGDLLIGIILKQNELVIPALVMIVISSGLIYVINKRR